MSTGNVLPVIGVPNPDFAALLQHAGVGFRLNPDRLERTGGSLDFFVTLYVGMHVHRLAAIIQGEVVGRSIGKR